MLTDNTSFSDRLINGSIGSAKHLDMRSNLLCGTIQANFDDTRAGSSLKDRGHRGELNECVPITARKNWFSLKKDKSTVIAERKQFPVTLDHAVTLVYMQDDLN